MAEMQTQGTPVLDPPAPGAAPARKAPMGKKNKGKNKWIGRIIAIVVAVAVIAGIAVGMYRFLFAEPEQEILRDTATYGSISNSIEGYGVTKALNSASITLTTGGTVQEVFVSEGDFVAEGTPLYTIDSTAAYEALARLQEPDFSALFSDQTQARASESGIALQIGLRTLIDGVDYSLTGYSYTLNCRETIQREDGTVEMNALETSVQNFAQFPGVDSERGRNFHSFVLEETADGWRIRSHMQYDTLYGQLMDGGDWRGDFAQAYTDAMPEFLAQLRAAYAQREAERGKGSTLPAADEPYDRTAALAYAGQYAMSRNANWADFSYSGGNCQNYVSQCLLAGGIPVDPYGDAVWTYGDGSRERSGSWASVTQFLQYASGNTGFGLVSQVGAPYYTGEPGDLIQMGTKEGWHHVVIIGDLVTDEAGNTVDYLIHSNTNDMKNYPASLYGYPVFALTRIASWNRG